MTDKVLQIGDAVQDIRDRTKRGLVTEGPVLKSGRPKLRVKWENGATAWLAPALLTTAGEDRSVEALLRERAFGGREDFVRSYTHRKLLTPVDDTLYSLSASRTQLLAHQFKPLIKFLESVHRRYLIADEVGLGKTIEAGIIVAELRARQQLGGVLIICPNHLRDKWRAELLKRFDEEFDIVTTRRDWLQRVDRWMKEGTEGTRSIIGHRTLASEKLMASLEQGVPGFDLIVVDEAHYARNPATLSRRILGELADAANQLLLLTATPLQTNIENLLSLLRLVDEDAFANPHLFRDRLDVNRRLVRAEAHLRRARVSSSARTDALRASLAELSRISPTERARFGLNTKDGLPAVEQALSAAVSIPNASLEDVAGPADQLRSLNLLAPFITRTRKSEVQSSCERRVRTVRPKLTEAEQEFYRVTVAWIRDAVRRQHGPEQVAFLTREPERRLASSFHGFWKHLMRATSSGREVTISSPPAHVRAAYDRIRRTDTKYRELKGLVARLSKDDPDAKVIVFASFKHTIAYLRHRLERDGVAFEWIHGDVPMDPTDPTRDERGKRVRRFLEDASCRVLVSSNVGGEGLDLQAASVVINYDLPWNPSAVEQRIGRVDRFGQERDVVHVANLVLPETVEDLVYSRLMDRLDLFRDSIGDLAAVLGPIVTELSSAFLAQQLSLEEMNEQARDAENRARNRIRDQQSLVERENEFIAFDEDFVDVLKGLETHGRTFRPDDVARVACAVVETHFRDSFLRTYEPDESEGIYELSAGFGLRQVLINTHHERPSGVLRRFLAQFPEGVPKLITFDGEVAERRTDLILITTRHPFMRALIEHTASAEAFHAVSAVRLPREATDLGPGLLTLFEAKLEFGPQTRRFLWPIFVPQDSPPTGLDPSRRLLRAALDAGRADPGREAPDGEVLVAMLSAAADHAEDALSQLTERILAGERRRIQPRVAELRARYDRRVLNTEARLRDAYQTRDEKRIEGIGRYLRRLTRERERRLEDIQRLPDPEEEIVPVGATWIAEDD